MYFCVRAIRKQYVLCTHVSLFYKTFCKYFSWWRSQIPKRTIQTKIYSVRREYATEISERQRNSLKLRSEREREKETNNIQKCSHTRVQLQEDFRSFSYHVFVSHKHTHIKTDTKKANECHYNHYNYEKRRASFICCLIHYRITIVHSQLNHFLLDWTID